MSAARESRKGMGILGDLLFIYAIVEAVRLVILFFGSLSGRDALAPFLSLTDRMTLPLESSAIKTPYGGVFDVDTVVTIVGILLVEWVVAEVRSRA